MNDKKEISKNRERKQRIVARLSEKTKNAKGMIFADYTSMSHQQIENLKRELKDSQTELVISKNTLLKRALEASETKVEFEPALNGPTFVLFANNDFIEPLKKLAKMVKLLNLPKVKFGILNGQALSSEELLRLSTLPSRSILLTQLAGELKSPILGLHWALSWNLQKLVMMLKAIQNKKT